MRWYPIQAANNQFTSKKAILKSETGNTIPLSSSYDALGTAGVMTVRGWVSDNLGDSNIAGLASRVIKSSWEFAEGAVAALPYTLIAAVLLTVTDFQSIQLASPVVVSIEQMTPIATTTLIWILASYREYEKIHCEYP